MFTYLLPICLALCQRVLSKTLIYDWDVTWVWASPDGFGRPVAGINNRFPCPPIEATVGDRVIVNLNNKLGNETTSLHFHGIYQTGTSAMDGPSGVTQCPIPPGASFTYDFVVNQSGTYWYHSHNKGQYIDGLRGPFIIRDPAAPFKFDEELTITLSDWYQGQAPDLINYFMSAANEDAGGSEPIPNSALIGDTQNTKFNVKPKTTYLVHVLNIGSFVGAYLKIDGHEMTIVEADGVYTESQAVDELYLTVAQRYSVLVTTKDDTSQNFAILSTLDTSMFDDFPPWANPDVYGYLIYDSSKSLPPVSPLRDYNVFDDFDLIPQDRQTAFTKVDEQIMITMNFEDDDGINRAIVNNVTYIPQNVPTLYTAMSAPKDVVMNPLIYGVNSNAFVLKFNQTIEIVLINLDSSGHPWHLHGHKFQVIARSPANTTYEASAIHPPQTPMRRDTIMVYTGGYIVLRFQADNPGIQLFHCHIEWHVEAGLIATLVEAPDVLQDTQSIPHDHYRVCKSQNIPTKGNAAGNTQNWLDLTGANTNISTNDYGALVNPPKRKRRSRVMRSLYNQG
ncbi:Ferroxidase [Hyaloscypha variabilis]